MRGQPNSRPDFRKLVFIPNPKRSGIFDLQGQNFKKFTFFRLALPKAPSLIQRGVKYVIESWIKGKKVLHTGLKETHRKNLYLGDHKGSRGNRSILIVHISHDLSKVEILYFNGFTIYPAQRRQFVDDHAGLFETKTGDESSPDDTQTHRHDIGIVSLKIQKNGGRY